MKTARGRGASRVGDFPRQSLGQEAAAVRMGHCADQRFRVRVERERPERLRRPRFDHDAEVHHRDDVGDMTDDREVV